MDYSVYARKALKPNRKRCFQGNNFSFFNIKAHFSELNILY